LTKHDLIDIIAQEAELTKHHAGDVIALIFDAVTEALRKGEDVRLIPFGNFVVRSRKKRIGRNPKTGAKITIPARKAPAFRAGSGLREAVGGAKKTSAPKPTPKPTSKPKPKAKSKR
jgi:nucleoid DNA-binding protein